MDKLLQSFIIIEKEDDFEFIEKSIYLESSNSLFISKHTSVHDFIDIMIEKLKELHEKVNQMKDETNNHFALYVDFQLKGISNQHYFYMENLKKEYKKIENDILLLYKHIPIDKCSFNQKEALQQLIIFYSN